MISIVNYNTGNIQSIYRKLTRLTDNVNIITTPEEVSKAKRLILPGVGHFGESMSYLEKSGLKEALNEAVIKNGIPIIGICLGMQLMARHSEEGNIEGLGWFDMNVTRMNVVDKYKYKVPHTGWNQITYEKSHPLMKNLDNNCEFYFVHAFYIKIAPKRDIISSTEYESEFVSGVQRDNIVGFQFHPEKSLKSGDTLLTNFINL